MTLLSKAGRNRFASAKTSRDCLSTFSMGKSLRSCVEIFGFTNRKVSRQHVQRKKQQVNRQADLHAPKTDEHGQRCRHRNDQHPGSYRHAVFGTDKLSEHTRLRVRVAPLKEQEPTDN